MASTFTLNSKSYDGRYLKVTCTQTTNTTTKKSTIAWKIEAVGGSNNYYTTGPTTLVIGGVQVYKKSRTSAHEFPCAKGSVSGSVEIEHTGAAGEKEIEVSISTAIYTSTVSTQKGTWTLDPIPNFVRIAYHPNGGTVGNTEKYGLNADGYISSLSENTVWFFSLAYGESNDVHNASTFGLKRTGYTFAGWKIMRDGPVIDQTTQYPSTIFTDTNDPAKNTSNATDVRCRLQAQWEPTESGIDIDVTVKLIDTSNCGLGLWLQNYCKAQLTASATGKYGEIVGYKWSTGETTQTIITTGLTTPGVHTWTVTATDDRGQTTTAEVAVEVLPFDGELFVPMVDNGSGWDVFIAAIEDGASWEKLLPVIDFSEKQTTTTAVLGKAILGQMILGKVD